MLILFFGSRIFWMLTRSVPTIAPVTAPAPQIRPIPAIPTFTDSRDLQATLNPADTATLGAFLETRQTWSHRTDGESQFSIRVMGNRVKWIGYLQGTPGPASLKLAAEDHILSPFVRLTPVSTDVIEKIRLFPIGTHVEVEGMLMDQQTLHLFGIRKID